MIIVNFATNQFIRGQERLKQSIQGKYNGLFLNNFSAIRSPHHKDSPYEFKIHSIEKAFQKDDIVLWCDSSLWLVGDLSKIERIIQQDGFFGSEAGHYAGRWTNGHAREYFKTTDEEMNEGPGGITLFSAGLLGLNRKSEIAMRFFEQWKRSAKAGCFKGHYSDHRHDQTCASIIATRLGLKYQRGGEHMSYIGDGYSPPEPESVFYLCGI